MQIFVLGMHRSGTSLATRLLNMAGAYVGAEGSLTSPNQENPKGFWERGDVRAINDELLRSAGCEWDRVSGFSLDLVPADVKARLETVARKIIFGLDAHRPWVLKEPRFCVTLPFWTPLAEIPLAVHVLRDPVEVAMSLRIRNGFEMDAGFALWEHHVLSQLRNAQGMPTAVAFHADLMRDPAASLRALLDRLMESGCRGLEMPAPLEITRFLSPDLHRARASHYAGSIPDSVGYVWSLLQQQAFEELGRSVPSDWSAHVLQDHERKSLTAEEAKKALSTAQQARGKLAELERRILEHDQKSSTLVELATAIAAKVGVGAASSPAPNSDMVELREALGTLQESTVGAIHAAFENVRAELAQHDSDYQIASVDLLEKRLREFDTGQRERTDRALALLNDIAANSCATGERLDSVASRLNKLVEQVGDIGGLLKETHKLREQASAADDRVRSAEQALQRSEESLRRIVARVHNVAEIYSASLSYRAARIISSPLRLMKRGGDDAIAHLRTLHASAQHHAPGSIQRAPVLPLGRASAPLAAGQVSGTKLGVIVLTLDGALLLERLLASLATHRPSTEFCVCVTDHGSKDGTADLLAKWQGRLPLQSHFAGNNHTFAYSNNRWAEQLQDCSHLLFLNNDIVFEGNVIDQMLAALEDGCTGVVGVDQRNEPGHQNGEWHHLGVDFKWDAEFSFWRPFNITSCEVRTSHSVEMPAVTGSVMLISRADFLEVGGFCERYNYGYEDVDLCLAVRARLGLRSICLRSDAVVHADGATRNKWPTARTRDARKSNIGVLRERARSWMRQWWTHRFAPGAGTERSGRPVVVFAVTEVGDNAAAGDLFTASELGSELGRRFGWTIDYRPAGEGWYALDGVDAVVAMVDSYDPRRITGAHPFLTRIAWTRNWFDRWCERPGAEFFDLWLASSQKSARYIADHIGAPERVLRIATSLEKFASAQRPTPDYDFVFTGSYWGAARDIILVAASLQNGLKGAVFGKNWERVPELRDIHEGFLSYSALPDLYRRSKIVIDDANHVTKPWGSVNSRVFDAVASGCLVITNSPEASDDGFGGELPVYESASQLREMLDTFARDERKRSEAVARLRARVVRDHTYGHRAGQLGEYLSAHLRDQMRIGIKIPVPDRKQAAEWGDYHFAASLARELRQRGCVVRLDFLPEWHDRRTVPDDVTLVIRGLNEYVPSDGEVAFLWIISHPDKVARSELARYKSVFVASTSYVDVLRRRTATPVFSLLQCTDPARFGAARNGAAAAEGAVLFVGNSRNVFRPIVRDAIAAGLKPDIYGTRWGNLVDASLIKGENIPNEQLGSYYASALVVLNDHWQDMAREGFLSNRLFDAVACGAVVISDDCAGLSEVFQDAVLVYDSPENLRHIIEEVARDSGSARARVDAVRARILAEHSFAARAEFLVRHMRRALQCGRRTEYA